MKVCCDVDFVLHRLNWMQQEQIWPNGLTAYSSQMARESELAKQTEGTHPTSLPTGELDISAIETAVQDSTSEIARILLHD